MQETPRCSPCKFCPVHNLKLREENEEYRKQYGDDLD